MMLVKRPAFQQVDGDFGHATALDAGLLLLPFQLVSTVVDQGRVSTPTGCVIAASLLRRPVTDLHRGWVWPREYWG
jgi:hypothetical protein